MPCIPYSSVSEDLKRTRGISWLIGVFTLDTEVKEMMKSQDKWHMSKTMVKVIRGRKKENEKMRNTG